MIYFLNQSLTLNTNMLKILLYQYHMRTLRFKHLGYEIGISTIGTENYEISLVKMRGKVVFRKRDKDEDIELPKALDLTEITNLIDAQVKDPEQKVDMFHYHVALLGSFDYSDATEELNYSHNMVDVVADLANSMSTVRDNFMVIVPGIVNPGIVKSIMKQVSCDVRIANILRNPYVDLYLNESPNEIEKYTNLINAVSTPVPYLSAILFMDDEELRDKNVVVHKESLVLETKTEFFDGHLVSQTGGENMFFCFNEAKAMKNYSRRACKTKRDHYRESAPLLEKAFNGEYIFNEFYSEHFATLPEVYTSKPFVKRYIDLAATKSVYMLDCIMSYDPSENPTEEELEEVATVSDDLCQQYFEYYLPLIEKYKRNNINPLTSLRYSKIDLSLYVYNKECT